MALLVFCIITLVAFSSSSSSWNSRIKECRSCNKKHNLCYGYAEFKSIVAVQRKWPTLHPGEKDLEDKALNRRMKQFKGTGSISKGVPPGCPSTSKENVEPIRQSCVRSPINPLLIKV